MNPFDFVNSINEKTGNLMDSSPDVERQYNSFIVNRTYSYRPDTILVSNTMNGLHHLDKRMQYDYYYATIKKSRKYSKWIKAEANPDEDAVMTLYAVSRRRAREYLSLMSSDDIKRVKEMIDTGGKR